MALRIEAIGILKVVKWICTGFSIFAWVSQGIFGVAKFSQGAFGVAKFSQADFGIAKFSHALQNALFFHLFWNFPAFDHQKLN